MKFAIVSLLFIGVVNVYSSPINIGIHTRNLLSDIEVGVEHILNGEFPSEVIHTLLDLIAQLTAGHTKRVLVSLKTILKRLTNKKGLIHARTINGKQLVKLKSVLEQNLSAPLAKLVYKFILAISKGGPVTNVLKKVKNTLAILLGKKIEVHPHRHRHPHHNKADKDIKTNSFETIRHILEDEFSPEEIDNFIDFTTQLEAGHPRRAFESLQIILKLLKNGHGSIKAHSLNDDKLGKLKIALKQNLGTPLDKLVYRLIVVLSRGGPNVNVLKKVTEILDEVLGDHHEANRHEERRRERKQEKRERLKHRVSISFLKKTVVVCLHYIIITLSL